MHATALERTPPPLATRARNIVYARHFLGISQAALARRFDPPRDRRQISRWERGTVEPGVANLRELAVHLGRNVEWFLDRHPEVDEWFRDEHPVIP